jgi:hypothetical protein
VRARIEWQGKYVRLVAIPYEPDGELNPFLHGNEEFVIEYERGRDLLGGQRWERVEVRSDVPIQPGIVRDVLAELVAALLAAKEAAKPEPLAWYPQAVILSGEGIRRWHLTPEQSVEIAKIIGPEATGESK